MLENFSRRATRVISEARREAGKRGVNQIDVNSLIIGFITEEQDPNSLELNAQGKRATETIQRPMLLPATHWQERGPSLLSQEVAGSFLAQLNEILPRCTPVPDTAEMPTSPEFQRAFSAAENLRQQFHRAKIEPLDLLAAALNEPCEASRLLIDAGITEEKVLQFPRSGEGSG
jgi:ATP-dependent Clp protease ATP-binding subunit ClpA